MMEDGLRNIDLDCDIPGRQIPDENINNVINHVELICKQDRAVIFSDQNQISIITDGLKQIMYAQKYCDVIITVGCHDFLAHRCVLAANSPYLESHFEDDATTSVVKVSLPLENVKAFAAVLDYMYTGNLLVSIETVHALLEMSNVLRLPNIVHCCGVYLEKATIQPENWSLVYQISRQYGFQEVLQKVTRFLNVDTAFNIELNNFSYEDFMNIVTSPFSCASDKQEYTKFQLVIKWALLDISDFTARFEKSIAFVDKTLLKDASILIDILDRSIKSKEVRKMQCIKEFMKMCKCNLQTFESVSSIKENTCEVPNICSTLNFDNNVLQNVDERDSRMLDNPDITTHEKSNVNLTINQQDEPVIQGESFQCTKCSKKFQTQSLLLRHERGHGSTQQFLCDFCGFSTHHAASLSVHKQLHKGKNYACPEEGCKYKSVRKSRLEDHIRKHKNLKSFVCSLCEKGFTSDRYLKRHEKIHSSANLFHCESCDYSSSRKDKLKEHHKKHHVKIDIIDNIGSTEDQRHRKLQVSSTVTSPKNLQLLGVIPRINYISDEENVVEDTEIMKVSKNNIK